MHPVLLFARAHLGCLSWLCLVVLSGCGETPSPTADAAAAQADATVDVPQLAEETTPDVTRKTEVATECPGAADCACKENAECSSSLCIDTPDGRKCARSCTVTCPENFRCSLVAVPGGDSTSICVPRWGRVCDPCTASTGCAALGMKDPVCLDQGAAGSYCGVACVDDADCPTSHACLTAKSVEGTSSKQCVRKPDAGGSGPGTCSCSNSAVLQALATPCFLESKDATGKVIGNCKGVRTCTAQGLSACTAPPPAGEVCDGVDNDCDGKVDESGCDDQNPCTQDVCKAVTGKLTCAHDPIEGPCDADGSVCTENDKCVAGACAAGPAAVCDDKNPCTSDTCDLAKGCTQTVADGKPCSDGNPCTVGDLCTGGGCVAGAANPCASGSSCVAGSCNLTDGLCKFKNKPNDLSCDDGTPCTKSDKCDAGDCAGKPIDCNDSNPCTDDACTLAAGCTHTDNSSACDDANPCTQKDTCGAGSCTGKAKVCDDGNPCTVDACDAKSGACTTKPGTTPSVCDDGNACTQGDVCGGGVCLGSTKQCADASPCTTDACNPTTGACANPAGNDGASCSDGDTCSTNDSCKAGACAGGAALACNDNDPCTVDACDAKTGCTTKAGNDGSACSDGNACSQADACKGGACAPGKPLNCDDNNACTNDKCDTKTGACGHPAVADGGGCDDGSACTGGDACAGGACKGITKDCGDGDACTSDGCAGSTGACTHVAGNPGGKCDDGNLCTSQDTCASGKCKGAAKFCDDAQPCTQDSCDTKTGQCGFVAVGAGTTCDDGNTCTTDDACVVPTSGSGSCVGKPKVCTDGNSCTDDSCNGGTCVFLNNTGKCNDGNACSGPDACSVGSCKGALVSCDDNNDCTADTCDANSGCAHKAVACTPCVPNADCMPANPCHAGKTVCTNGKSSCTDTGKSAPDGTECGLNNACVAGECVTYTNGASIVTGDGQTGAIDSLLLPVVVKVVDGNNAAVVGATVTVTSPIGAAATPQTGKTNVQGRFVFSPRLGRAKGAYSYKVSAASAAPIQVKATAVIPDPGITFTLVNIDHSSGNDGKPGAATVAHTGNLYGMAMVSDGSIYLADTGNHHILHLSPAGHLKVVAGTTQGFAGNNGPATAAKLNWPTSVALDEAEQQLYISDTNNDVVRVVDLPSGTISAFAGGGTAPAPGYGDSGPGIAAKFNKPAHVFKGPDAAVYVADTYHGRIRRVDTVTSLVSPWLGNPGGPKCTGGVELYSCGGPGFAYVGWPGGCQVAWDSDGNAYVSGQLCGGSTGQGYGVMRRAPDGSVTHIAGKQGGSETDGGAATTSAFSSGVGGIALDKAGNVYVSEPNKHRIRRIEQASGRVTTVLGNGTAGYAGDYVPAAQVQVNLPWALNMDAAQNLIFTDSSNFALRQVTSFGQIQPTPAVLTIVSGDKQENLVDQVLPAPFSVKLTDGNGKGLAGYVVKFTLLDPGAALYATDVATGFNGTANTVGRLGLATGDYKVQASFKDLAGKDVSGSPVQFTMKATPPAAGTVFTALNIDHSAANDGKPGAATLAHANSLLDFVAAADGTLYLADTPQHLVYKMTPAGYLTVLAGTGAGGFSGDNGPANGAQLSWPSSVALDEANQQLYIADTNNDRIRVVDLKTGILSPFAGGGGAPGPGYGDSGPAAAAKFSKPMHVYKGPDAALYVADAYHGRIRRIDLGTQIVTPWLGTGSATCTAPLELKGCGGNNIPYVGWPGGCAITWDAAGNAYIGGQICGSTSGDTLGILKRAKDGTLSHIAGLQGGNEGAGGFANASVIGAPSSLALDPNGRLWFTEPMNNRLRMIEGGKLKTMAGNGTAGYSGDYVPLAEAVLNRPWSIQFLSNGHMAFTDSGNYSLRYRW